jgi:hypothetical protein
MYYDKQDSSQRVELSTWKALYAHLSEQYGAEDNISTKDALKLIHRDKTFKKKHIASTILIKGTYLGCVTGADEKDDAMKIKPQVPFKNSDAEYFMILQSQIKKVKIYERVDVIKII